MSKRLALLFVVSGILFDSVVNFPTLAQSPQLSQPSNANNPFIRVENDFKIELKGCQREDINVTCSLLITNQGIKERGFGINGDSMLRAIDKSGNIYTGKGREVGSSVYVVIPQGIPVKGSVSFEIPPNVARFAVLDLPYYGDSSGKVQFRDINIAGAVSTDACNCQCPNQ
ncbi:hypothetical protein NIES593_12150 [Hydrococcus rivularis NIES-593]|uniref:DUF4352 domain-containing protein n=1 Tax=Hydrococcus rivularis NIES-593 TaxID=1921803 RepID=A0A1U7HG17_9CYAN|nr:hypothetical protein [Hydrococcus rivularis]OKH22542.1 hypothetical protein NIES593_12150 [Hydrococcus rivularis NIES-593]